jgi:cholesterol transport system auxiliary component
MIKLLRSVCANAPMAVSRRSLTHLLQRVLSGVALASLCACANLRLPTTPNTAYYTLDSSPLPAAATATETPAQITTLPTLLVNPPHAMAGFDSPRIVYLREPHRLDYFANSQWVDPPARMLGPLLVAAIEKSGAFAAVVLVPGAADGALRLDSEIIRLQHDFQTRPSHVRFSLRVTLVNDKTRQVVSLQEFEAIEPASSEDAYGGVLAANHAVQQVVQQVAARLALVLQ